MHENQNWFFTVHEKSLLRFDGKNGLSDAPEAFLFVDVSYIVTGSWCRVQLKYYGTR